MCLKPDLTSELKPVLKPEFKSLIQSCMSRLCFLCEDVEDDDVNLQLIYSCFAQTLKIRLLWVSLSLSHKHTLELGLWWSHDCR